MKHRNEQEMLLYFLNLNYDADWKDVELEAGYKFGDYRFSKLKPDEVMPIVKMMWIQLNGKKLSEGQV